MSVTVIGGLPFPEHLRRPEGFFGASGNVRLGNVGAGRPAEDLFIKGAGGDWNAICCPEIPKQRDGYTVPSAPNIACAKLAICINYSGSCCKREIPNFCIL
jgi:hypothetical protein